MKPPLLLLLIGLLGLTCAGCRRDPAPSTAQLKAAERRLRQDHEAARRWFERIYLEGYEQHGQHGPWDDSVKSALGLLVSARTPGREVPEDWESTVSALAASAVDAGCADPLVHYLMQRYAVANVRRAGAEAAWSMSRVAEELQASPYAVNLRFYGALRASEAIKGSTNNTPQEVHHYRYMALSLLQEQITDPTTPESELYAMVGGLLDAVNRNSRQYAEFWPQLEESLLAHWKDRPFVHLLKGDYFISYAWKARGNGMADTVTEEGWRLFKERLETAEKALRRASQLDPTDPRPATRMLTVARGLGLPLPQHEKWFRAAMTADPKNYEACQNLLTTLEPKWGGSAEAMVAFGRECLTNRAWSGQVPLTLSDAHGRLAGYFRGEERQRYWRQPEVWGDIEASFAAFFARHPEAQGWKHSFAAYAFQCGQWDAFLGAVREFPSTNHAYFGGPETFDRMLAHAREQTAR